MDEEKNTFTIAKLIPNMITLAALFFGLFSVKLSISGDFKEAAIYLILAAVMDAFDGKIARKLNVSSDFGAEMDSLADFFNFGIAPGFFVYFWKMQFINSDLKLLAWLPLMLLAACMAIRLARFNIDLGTDDPNSPLIKYFFKGCPAPMDALWVILPFAFETEFMINVSPVLVIINTIVVAFFAVSTVPTFTPKKMKIKNEYKNVILLIVALLTAGLLLKTWLTLVIFYTIYFISILFGWVLYIKYKKNLNK